MALILLKKLRQTQVGSEIRCHFEMKSSRRKIVWEQAANLWSYSQVIAAEAAAAASAATAAGPSSASAKSSSVSIQPTSSSSSRSAYGKSKQSSKDLAANSFNANDPMAAAIAAMQVRNKIYCSFENLSEE